MTPVPATDIEAFVDAVYIPYVPGVLERDAFFATVSSVNEPVLYEEPTLPRESLYCT